MMHRTVRTLILVAIVAVVALSLTGCAEGITGTWYNASLINGESRFSETVYDKNGTYAGKQYDSNTKLENEFEGKWKLDGDTLIETFVTEDGEEITSEYVYDAKSGRLIDPGTPGRGMYRDKAEALDNPWVTNF